MFDEILLITVLKGNLIQCPCCGFYYYYETYYQIDGKKYCVDCGENIIYWKFDDYMGNDMVGSYSRGE